MLEGAIGSPASGRPRGPGATAAPRPRQVLAQNASLVVAGTLLVAMLVLYIVLYIGSLGAFPGAFEAASIADHALPLSLAAVGQSLVILTRGIDLSVGGMMDLTNSLAALKLQGGLATEALWTVIILLVGAAGGLLNGLLVAYGRIQPILVTLGTLSIFQGLALWVLPSPGGHVASGYTGLFLNPNAPSALIFVVLLALAWVAFRRTRLGVQIFAVGNDEAAARANSVPVARTKVLVYVLAGMLAAAAGIALATTTTGGRRHRRGRVHPVLDRGRGRRRSVAVRRARKCGRGDLRRIRAHRAGRRAVLREHRPAVPALLPGAVPGRRGRCEHPARSCSGEAKMSSTSPSSRAPGALRLALNPDRRRILYGFIAAIALFVLGDILTPGFASSSGIQQILEVSSFVGLVAAGQTFVILIGGIDLSVPWVLNGAAILMVAVANGSDSRLALGIAVALVFGVACGVVNGLGISLLGVPAVVMTLGMNGIIQGLSLGVTHGLTCGGCTKPPPTGAGQRHDRQDPGHRHQPVDLAGGDRDRVVHAVVHHVRSTGVLRG